MTAAQAKRAASANGFDMWWEPRWKVWAIRPHGADPVEASGGAYLSSGSVRTLTVERFITAFLR